jgi:ATP phosphoribosyltransferase regulatory subunit
VPARYCYAGPAFRYQPADADRAHPREFRQAGIESFAAADRERDDAAVLVLTVAALREAGLRDVRLQLGDLGLFAALINALPMPERWRLRLRHQLPRPGAFRAELSRLAAGPVRDAAALEGLLNRLDPDDPAGAEALVLEHLDQAGIELIGTRTAAEIAQRLLAEAADRRARPLPVETAALIEAYVTVQGPARTAVERVAKLARRYGIGDLSAGLQAFARRLDLIEEAGVSTAKAQFSTEFGRTLDYYTGFVFEAVTPALGPRSPVAGGGRYDNMLAEVGAPVSVPAVGASIHTERLLAALQEAAR